MARRFYYGGQAVIDGVMMRGRKAMVTAVRRPDGGIAMDIQPLGSIYVGRLRKTPLIRGIIVLVEAIVLGIKSLLYSANVSLEEEEEKISGGLVWVLMAVSLAFSIALFSLAPLFLTNKLLDSSTHTILFNLTEGLIRIAIFILYLGLINLIPSIKQVFAYHGAEHKAVNAYEDGVSLELETVRRYNTAHRRCGTSFLFIVLVIAILVFSITGRPSLWLMVLPRILLVPVIAAIAYEVIYFAANHADNRLVRALIAPGLWLQAMTTRQPDDKQLEVALSALAKAVEVDQLEEAA